MERNKAMFYLVASYIIFLSFPNAYSQAPSPGNSYLDYAQILAWLFARQTESGGYMNVFDITDPQGKPIRTANNHTIKAVEITDRADDKNDLRKPDIIITGCHHAREWTTVNMCLLLIQFLLKHREDDRPLKEYDDKKYPFKLLAEMGIDEFFDTKDITIKRLLKSAEIIIVPVVNPDGYIYSRTPGTFICYDYYFQQDGIPWHYDITSRSNNMWRKNRSDISQIPIIIEGQSILITQGGVDLNRNYPFMWTPPKTATDDPRDCETYRGPAPASEKEVQAMIYLHKRREPLAAIDYHSYGGIVAYPWGYTTTPITSNQRSLDPYDEIGDNYTFRDIASKMGKLINAVSLETIYGTQQEYIFIQSSTSPLYPTSGDSIDWRYQETGCAAFLIEIGEWFQPDIEEQIDGKTRMERTFNENLPAALFLMFWVVDRKFSQKPAIQITK